VIGFFHKYENNSNSDLRIKRYIIN